MEKENSMFNKYAEYPNKPGVIITRNKQGQFGFAMYTDNIKARVESVDKDHINGTYGDAQAPWGEGRKAWAQASGLLVFEYIVMPNTDRDTRKMVAEALDAESLSKTQEQQ